MSDIEESLSSRRDESPFVRSHIFGNNADECHQRLKQVREVIPQLGVIPRECKRLAEVDFPIAVVSKHAAREKSIRHGHPSTLTPLALGPALERFAR